MTPNPNFQKTIRLITAATNLRDKDPTIALRLYARAFRLAAPHEADAGLRKNATALYRDNIFYQELAPIRVITGALFTPDEDAILTLGDKNAWLWDLDGSPNRVVAAHPHPISAAAFSPDGSYLVTGDENGTLRVWDQFGNLLHSGPHKSSQQIFRRVLDIQVFPDNKHFLSCGIGTVINQYSMSGQLVHQYNLRHKSIHEIQLIQASNTILSVGKGFAAKTDLQTKETRFLLDEGRFINRHWFSKGNQHYLMTADTGGNLNIYDEEQSLHTALKGPAESVITLTAAPDGNSFAFGYRDGSILLLNQEGEQLAINRTLNQAIYSLQFSKNGRQLLAAASNDNAFLWNLDTDQIQTLDTRTDAERESIYLTEKQQFFVYNNNKHEISLRDWKGNRISTFLAELPEIHSMAYVETQQRLLLHTLDNEIQIYDAAGRLENQFPLPAGTSEPEKVIIRPLGGQHQSFLFSNQTESPQIISNEGKTLAHLRQVKGPVQVISINREGTQIAIAPDSDRIGIWDTEGQKIGEHPEEWTETEALAWFPKDKTLISGHENHKVELWELEVREDLTYSTCLDQEIVTCLSVSEDEEWIASCDLRNHGYVTYLGQFYFPDDYLSIAFRHNSSRIKKLMFTPDGSSLITKEESGAWKRWPLRGTCKRVIPNVPEQSNCFTVSPEGKQYVWPDEEGFLALHDEQGTKSLVMTEVAATDIKDLCFSPDGKWLGIAISEGAISIRNTENHTQQAICSEGMTSVFSLAFSPDSKTIAAGLLDEQIACYDMEGKLLKTINHSPDALIEVLVYNPDGNMLFTGTDEGHIHGYRLQDDVRTFNVFAPGRRAVKDLAITSDGQSLFSLTDKGTATLWNLEGEIILELESKLAAFKLPPINSIACSPTENLLLTGHREGAVILWDPDGNPLHTFRGHTGTITHLFFLENGKTAVSLSSKGELRYWNIPPTPDRFLLNNDLQYFSQAQLQGYVEDNN